MRVSVIIPALNAEATLQICLGAVLTQTRPPDEVIVVDNGSTDRTRTIVEDFPYRRELIRLFHEEQRGQVRARNRGVAESTGEILVFTDADCVPDPRWLELLIAPFQADCTLDAVAGKVTGHDPKTFIQRAISVTSFPAPEHARTLRGLAFPPVTFYTGNFAVRRRGLTVIGGFDERLWIMEDVDLCCRLLRHGRIQYIPEACVGHIQHDSLRKVIRRQFQYGTGLPAIFRKHYPDGAWLTLPGRRVISLPGPLRPCWVSLASPDRVLTLLALGAVWQPWVAFLGGLYLLRIGQRLYRTARSRGVPIAPWELPFLTAIHVGEFTAFSAGCLIGAVRNRILCIA